MLRWLAFAIFVMLLSQLDWLGLAAGWLGFTGPAPLIGAAEAKEAPAAGFGAWPAWLGFVLLLPAITMGFLRTVARKRSNTLNAYVLILYSGAGVIAAILVSTFSGHMPGLAAWTGIFLGSLAYAFAGLSVATHLES